jgi:hypothetical protein
VYRVHAGEAYGDTQLPKQSMLTRRRVQRTFKAHPGLCRSIQADPQQGFASEPENFSGEPALVRLLNLGACLFEEMQSSPKIAGPDFDLGLQGQEVGQHIFRPGCSPLLRSAPDGCSTSFEIARIGQRPAS